MEALRRNYGCATQIKVVVAIMIIIYVTARSFGQETSTLLYLESMRNISDIMTSQTEEIYSMRLATVQGTDNIVCVGGFLGGIAMIMLVVSIIKGRIR